MKKTFEMKDLIWTKIGDGTYAVAWDWRIKGNKKWRPEYDFVNAKELGFYIARLKKTHNLVA